jgi:hypothetical protein
MGPHPERRGSSHTFRESTPPSHDDRVDSTRSSRSSPFGQPGAASRKGLEWFAVGAFGQTDIVSAGSLPATPRTRFVISRLEELGHDERTRT